MLRAIFGLGVVDAALLALLLKSQPDRVGDFLILFSPVIIFVALAVWIKHHSFRQGIILLEAAYSIIAAAIIWWTFFGGEHDAGYQLILLFIPIIGFLGVLIAGAAAIAVRPNAAAAKQAD